MRMVQGCLNAFNHAMRRLYPKVPNNSKPTLLDRERVDLRKNLIEEEVKETLQALERGDMVEIADGIVDSIYVLVGTAEEMGIDLDPIWDEVHASNMRKFDGARIREDGKFLKPDGWTPPNVRAELEQQGWEPNQENTQ